MTFTKNQKHRWYLHPENRKKYIAAALEWSKKNPLAYGYSRIKTSAKNRKLGFNLTKITYAEIVSQPCYYCGKLQKNFNGIDRIDNSQGYLLENCVSCCKMCNQMKHAFKVDNFLEKCKQIIEKRGLLS